MDIGCASCQAVLGEGCRRRLEQIEIASQRAADLCKQMLAYSGKGRFIVQHLDLNSLVRETSELLQVSWLLVASTTSTGLPTSI